MGPFLEVKDSLGTRASVTATPRCCCIVSFHLLASFTLTPVEMFSVWQRTWRLKQRESCLLPEATHQSQGRMTGPISAPGEWGAVNGQPGSYIHPCSQDMGCDQGEGHRQASRKDTNEQSSIQTVIRVI